MILVAFQMLIAVRVVAALIRGEWTSALLGVVVTVVGDGMVAAAWARRSEDPETH